MLLKVTQNIYKGCDLSSEGKVINNWSIHSMSINRDMYIFIHFPLSGPIKTVGDQSSPSYHSTAFSALLICDGVKVIRQSLLALSFFTSETFITKNKARTFRFSKSRLSFWIPQCLHHRYLWYFGNLHHQITALPGIPGCNTWNLTYCPVTKLWLPIFLFLFCCREYKTCNTFSWVLVLFAWSCTAFHQSTTFEVLAERWDKTPAFFT